MAQVLPKLPAAFSDFLPTAEFGMGLNRIQNYDVMTVNGYDAMRAMGTATMMCVECAVRAGEIQRVVLSGV